jgi:hypothetical protein
LPSEGQPRFEKLFYHLVDTCRRVAPGKNFRFKNKPLSLDATIIELCATIFDWAKFQWTKEAVKLKLLLDYDPLPAGAFA